MNQHNSAKSADQAGGPGAAAASARLPAMLAPGSQRLEVTTRGEKGMEHALCGSPGQLWV